jgi:type I site-specific restriction endonuclease
MVQALWLKTCREDFNHGDDFVKEITGNRNVDRPLLRIREFRKRPNPKVVVTVDMLSTGNKSKFIVFDCFDRTHLAS